MSKESKETYPVDEEIARARHKAAIEKSWGSYIPRGFSVAVVAACAVAALAQKPPTPAPEANPTLSASQQIALKAIDDDETDLKQKWQIDEAKKAAVLAEFSKDHTGWYLGPNNTPTKTTPPPAPEPKK